MKRRTIRLLALASFLYGILLLILRSIIQDEYTASLSLLVVPLAILMVIVLRDLHNRATEPSKVMAPPSYPDEKRQIELLSGQVQVASTSSYEYLDSTLFKRLREIIADRVSLETGIDGEKIRTTLADQEQGPRLLRDDTLYRALWSKPREEKPTGLRAIGEVVDRIRAWKPSIYNIVVSDKIDGRDLEAASSD